MEIFELPNEVKEKIFIRVYERQCFDVVIEGNSTRKLIEMLWSYNNDLARAIVWKWLVWWCYRTLLPENIEFIRDHIYERFRKMIAKSYKNLYEDSGIDSVNPLEVQRKMEESVEMKPLRWYSIEPEINNYLKTFLHSRNKRQIEKHILRYHEGTNGIGPVGKTTLIFSFCNKFPRSFLPSLCFLCGKEPPSHKDIITYPCKHKICKNCFLDFVSKFERSCHIYDSETKQICGQELRQKGWNYYLLKHVKYKDDYQKCRRCHFIQKIYGFYDGYCGSCYSNLLFRRVELSTC